MSNFSSYFNASSAGFFQRFNIITTLFDSLLTTENPQTTYDNLPYLDSNQLHGFYGPACLATSCGDAYTDVIAARACLCRWISTLVARHTHLKIRVNRR
jgi:hypothetical protein